MSNVSFSTAGSEANSAYAYAIIDGIQTKAISFRVTRTSHGAADTGTIVVAASDPANLIDWSQQLAYAASDSGAPSSPLVTGAVRAEIHGVIDSIDSGRLFGTLDQYSYDPDDNTVTFTMRNFAALLIADKITTQLSSGQTTVAFIRAIAASVGLDVNIALSPGQVPGTLAEVYASDNIFSVRNARKWDVAVKCAEFDAAYIWVDGDTLNYSTYDQIPRIVGDLVYGRDIKEKSFKGTHSPQFNRNIKVEVQSNSPRSRFSQTQTASIDDNGNIVTTSTSRTVTLTQNGGGSVTRQVNGGTPTTTASTTTGGLANSGYTRIPAEQSGEHYLIRKPNLSTDACNRLAIATALQYARREYQATFALPMTAYNLNLAEITTLYRISGVPYARFNTSPSSPYFFPRKIDETFDVSGGWSFTPDCLNHRLAQAGV